LLSKERAGTGDPSDRAGAERSAIWVPIQEIVICDNCSGTGIAGAECGRDHESAAGRGNETKAMLEEKTVREKGRALLEKLSLALWASRVGKNYWSCWTSLIQDCGVNAAVEQEAKKRPEVVQLMTPSWRGTHHGTAYVLVIGTPGRFPAQADRQLHGLIPCEDSSAGKQRLGHISKQAILCCAFCW